MREGTGCEGGQRSVKECKGGNRSVREGRRV